MIVDEICLVGFPGRRVAEDVAPASSLGDEAEPSFVDPLLQALDILCGGQGAVIEEVLVDAIRNQEVKVRTAESGLEAGHHAERSIVSRLGG